MTPRFEALGFEKKDRAGTGYECSTTSELALKSSTAINLFKREFSLHILTNAGHPI